MGAAVGMEELYNPLYRSIVDYCEKRCKKDCMGWNDCERVKREKKRLMEASDF